MKTMTGFVVHLTTPGSNLAHAQSPEGTWHGERDGVTFYPSGENLAYDKPAATVHPKLTEHSQKMVPGVYQVAENVYLAYGNALTSPAMIVGDDGVIIVDPPEDVNKGRRTLEEFRKFSDKPVNPARMLATGNTSNATNAKILPPCVLVSSGL